MSIEFDRSYIEEVVMLSGLALFLILAALMPHRRHTVPSLKRYELQRVRKHG